MEYVIFKLLFDLKYIADLEYIIQTLFKIKHQLLSLEHVKQYHKNIV